MNVCKFSVTHPVSTIVLMLLIVLAGTIAFLRLPIREYPDIETPTVSISTKYTGGAQNVIETKITQVIENAVSGIDGINTIQSTSREGRSTVKIEFNSNKDIDSAVNDVRDKVSRSINKLPDEADSPIIAKFDADSMPIMILAVTSDNMNRMEITDYINRYLLDRFSIIDGVAEASIIGKREKSIRIWLKKDAMAARMVTVSDIESTLKRENMEYPGGRIESDRKEYPIIIQRKYNTVIDFQDLVIGKNRDGDFIKLSDVADIEVASKEQRDNFSCNKEPMVGISITKQSHSNTVQIARDVQKLISKLEYNLPSGMSIRIIRDDSKFIKNSINEVYETLVLAAILVFAIIFVFLGNVKATVIPFITVPISVIGSFSIINILGYSINMLTLLAMVLGIGIVVDDSIVVLENIYRKMEEGESTFDAALSGSKQVIFAVISSTIVLLAVFLPICIWSGKTGKLFSEFAVTISSAIILSGVVALTLTPMLCAKMLSKHDKNYNITHVAMTKLSAFQGKILYALSQHRRLVLCSFLVLSTISSLVWYSLHNEYEPLEDRSVIMVKSRAIEGTGFQAMCDYMNKAEDAISQDKKSIKNILNIVPSMGGGGNGAVTSGHLMIELTDYKNRPNSQILAGNYRKKLKKIIGLKSGVSLPSGIAAKGTYPVQFVIAGPEYEELKAWRDIIFEKSKSYKGLVDIDSDYQETTPQFVIDIDTKRIADLHVSIKEIGSTLETMFGSKAVTSYIDGGREYDVVLQAKPRDRKCIDDITGVYVRSDEGQLIGLDNIISIREKGVPTKLSRFNRNRAITISANVGDGYSLDQALTYLNDVVKKRLPPYAQVFYGGKSKELTESANGLYTVFFLAIVVSFLILAAQFESFISPFVVMLSVPLGAFGAVIALYITGHALNIYNQIGLLMLIGLSTKQGILIVEFANQLMAEGMTVIDAAVKATQIRLRPIIMTCISTIVGAIPLLLAQGASAAGRVNIGLVEVFGCASGLVLISVILPILYITIQSLKAVRNGE